MSEFDGMTLNRCAACLAEDRAAQEAQHLEWEQARERVQVVLAALVAAGCPGADRSEPHEERYGLFGRKTRTVMRDTATPSWPVGPITVKRWASDDEHYRTEMVSIRADGSMSETVEYARDWPAVLASLESISRHHGVVLDAL